MKTMSARDAKNAFGLMIGTACAGPVLIGKHGHGVVVVVTAEEPERLTVQLDVREKTIAQIADQGADQKLKGESFARIKADQRLKDADWCLTDGPGMRYNRRLREAGTADLALFEPLSTGPRWAQIDARESARSCCCQSRVRAGRNHVRRLRFSSVRKARNLSASPSIWFMSHVVCSDAALKAAAF